MFRSLSGSNPTADNGLRYESALGSEKFIFAVFWWFYANTVNWSNFKKEGSGEVRTRDLLRVKQT